MEYYAVKINIVDPKEHYKRRYFICQNLRKALKCANHYAWIYEFTPFEHRKDLNKWKWDEICEYWFKHYQEGYIIIKKKQMWEDPGSYYKY